MNKVITPDDVIGTVKSFVDCNSSDDSTINIVLAIGAELLDVSSDTILEIINDDRECPNCGCKPKDEPYCMDGTTHCPMCGYVFK